MTTVHSQGSQVYNSQSFGGGSVKGEKLGPSLTLAAGFEPATVRLIVATTATLSSRSTAELRKIRLVNPDAQGTPYTLE